MQNLLYRERLLKNQSMQIGEVPQRGVGTELKRILARFGIRPKPTCKCVQRASRMDREGISWCEQNIGLIVDWLEEEAHNRSLPFAKLLGRALVKRAIRNARRSKQEV